jgi:transposase
MIKIQFFEMIPEDTLHVARSVFHDGNAYIHMRDKLPSVLMKQDSLDRYVWISATDWRLVIINAMQQIERLTDPQTANAIRGRIDWKYACGLSLADPGFPATTFQQFRVRLKNSPEMLGLLNLIMDEIKEYEETNGFIYTSPYDLYIR